MAKETSGKESVGKALGDAVRGAVETVADVSRRQRREWERFNHEIIQPLFERVTGGDEKNAKTLADILKIAQEGERKAWGFGSESAAPDNEIIVSFEEN